MKFSPLIVALYALLLLFFPAVQAADEGFVSLFDGKTLNGWRGKEELWSVRDGAIVGSSKPAGIKSNTFLVYAEPFGDFVLRFEYKFSGGNSGVQFRSAYTDDRANYVIRGYQADIGEGYFGSLYDEKRRGMLQAAAGEWVAAFLKENEWNRYEITAQGKNITLKINDLITAKYTEADSEIPRSGLLALQLHGGKGMEIQFRNIQIKEKNKAKLLYVTTAAGYPHRSRPRSREVVELIGRDSGEFEATTTDTTELITPSSLKNFDAVMFYTTGGKDKFPLTKENREALIQFVRDGGAFIGTHSATDTYGDWEPYWEMIGGTFAAHPWNANDPPIMIDVEDPSHPAALPVPYGWMIQDEIYQFRQFNRGRLHVILSMNAGSVGGKGSRLDNDYPIAWCREYGKGKVFYTSLGHREDVWDNPIYQAHLLGGIGWAVGAPGYHGDATPGLPKPSNQFVDLFDGVTLSGWGPNLVTPIKLGDKEQVDDAVWTVVEDGVIHGKGGNHGHLVSPRTYENFHYKADLWIGDGGNSGMYFRCNRGVEKWPSGYEAQINSNQRDPVRTGSLYFIHKEFRQLAPPETWFTQEVIAYGQHIIVKVNGEITASLKITKDNFPSKLYKRGYFAYQFHDPGCEVKMRNVMVRELPSLGD